MKRKPVIVVYGNCQAEAVSAVLSNDPAASDDFEILYVPSFEHPTRRDMIREEDLARTVLLMEQRDPRPFPHRDRLGSAARVVTFPATDFNLLWPFNCTNPYDRAESEVFPYGRFPYGNRIIAQFVAAGMTESEIFTNYFERWDTFAPPLQRMFELEQERIASRDRDCDVAMGDFIFSEFKHRRLFWTINHPSSFLLKELIQRILDHAATCDPAFSVFKTFRIDETIDYRFSPEGPLGVVSVPIDSKIVSFFGLDWYDPKRLHQSYGGVRYTEEDYYKQLISWSVRVKQSSLSDAEL